MGYKGLKQSTVFFNTLNQAEIEVNEKEVIYNKESTGYASSNERFDKIKNEERFVTYNKEIDKLFEYIENKKPYLKDKLMITDIAVAIDIPLYKLTKIFNDNLKTNFFFFINSYRVKEFKEMLSNSKNDQYTIIALAHDCGFSSKSSFNRIFKQVTGITPSEYRRNLRLEP